MTLSARKQAGVCLHFTSLPGKYGIGEIGAAARAFIDQMIAMSVIRALESGRPLVRSTNDGVSCRITANGRVLDELERGRDLRDLAAVGGASPGGGARHAHFPL